MWSTAETTAALVAARNEGKTLESVKKDDPKDADADGGVAPVLEALGAVIPTGITVIYTGGALLLQGLAETQGKGERAEKEAALAAAGKTAAEIEKALGEMAAESSNYVALRIALFAVAVVVAGWMAFTAASKANARASKKRKYVVAEPATAVFAFVAWALASPGTFLAAYLNPGELVASSAFIVTVTGLILLAAGQVVLKKPSKTT